MSAQYTKNVLMMTVAGVVAFAAAAQAATYYWDNNGITGGFGTAGGTWAAPTADQWSTDSTGVAAPGASVTTTTGDILYFGYGANGLGAGAITVSGTVAAKYLYFSKDSAAITLDGGTIDLSVGGRSVIQANSGTATPSTHTINSDLTKSSTGDNCLQFGTQTTAGENYIVNGVISGTCYIDNRVQNGSSYVAYNGTNTFSGSFNIVTGQANVNSVTNSGEACSLGAGSVISMAGNGGQSPTLWYTGTSSGSMNRTINLNGGGADRLVSQDAPLTLSGPVTGVYSGYQSVLSLSGDAGGGSNLNEISGAIGGNLRLEVVSFTPVGSGTHAEDGYWRLSGNNSYSGTTTISAGTLVIKHNNALGDTNSSTIVANNSTAHLQFDGSSGDLTVPEPITIQGGQSGSIRNLSGANTLSGAVTLTSGADFRINSGTMTFSGGITSANNSGTSLNGQYAIDTMPITIGSGTIIFTSNGNNPATPTLVNVGGNAWGNTIIDFGGYVKLGVNDALPTDTSIHWGWSLPSQSAGTLDLNGYNQTVTAIKANPLFPTVSGDQKITGGSGTFTINQVSGTNTWFGRFEGDISVVKNGAGMLVISGTNTNTGATSVSVAAGALGLTHTAVLSTNATVYITSGAVVELSAGTHVIRNLYIDGVKQRKTFLNAAKLPGFLSGTGSFFPTEGWSGTLISVH